MSEARKQAVSIRMSHADIRKLRRLARRLGVSNSDIIRFAVKSMLGRLAPLYDAEAAGRSLVPVFVESGAELLRFFEIDAAGLDAIINQGAEQERRVDREDIALIAMSSSQETYAAIKLGELDERARGGEPAELSQSLRQYLYGKYVYRSPADGTGRPSPRLVASLDEVEVAEG